MKTVKTRQHAKSQIAVNTWVCSFKYKSPSKFENVKENTDEVVASTQVGEYDNPQPSAPSSPPRRSTPSSRRPPHSHNLGPCLRS
jgi:hypothetical protein